MWKFWAEDEICLKQAGGTQISQVQWLLENAALSHKSWSPGLCFSSPWNPSVNKVTDPCNVSAGSSAAPSSAPAQTETSPAPGTLTTLEQGEAHLGAGNHSQSTNLMLYSPLQWLLCTFPNDYCTSRSETVQSGATQRQIAFVNKY